MRQQTFEQSGFTRVLCTLLCWSIALTPYVSQTSWAGDVPESLDQFSIESIQSTSPQVRMVNLGSMKDADLFGQKVLLENSEKSSDYQYLIFHLGKAIPEELKWAILHMDRVGIQYELRRIDPDTILQELNAIENQLTDPSNHLPEVAQFVEKLAKNPESAEKTSLVFQSNAHDKRPPGQQSESHRQAIEAYFKSPLGLSQIQYEKSQAAVNLENELATQDQANGVVKKLAQAIKLKIKTLFGVTEFSWWIKVPRDAAIKKFDFDKATWRLPPTAISIFATSYLKHFADQKEGFWDALNHHGVFGSLSEAIQDPRVNITLITMNLFIWVNGYWFRSLRATMNQGKDLVETKLGVFEIRANNKFSWLANFIRGMTTNLIFICSSGLILPWQIFANGMGTLFKSAVNAIVGTFARAQIDKRISDLTPKAGRDGKITVRPGQLSERAAGWLDFSWGISYGFIKNLSLIDYGWLVNAIYYGLGAFNLAWSIDEKNGAKFERAAVHQVKAKRSKLSAAMLRCRELLKGDKEK